MARIDKYEPLSGGHRAPLGFQLVAADLEKPIPVGLNASGRVVRGAGNTGVIGVLVLTQIKNLGDIVDVMQDGELVDCVGVGPAGTRLFASAAGVVSTTNTGTPLGYMIEADRFCVRVGRIVGAA